MKKLIFSLIALALVSAFGTNAKPFYEDELTAITDTNQFGVYYVPVIGRKGPVSPSTKGKKGFIPFARGLNQDMAERPMFIPRGTVGIGTTFSYNSYSVGESDDDAGYSMLFSLVSGLKANMTVWSMTPHIDYFINDNMSLGHRFKYSRNNLGLDLANLGVDALSFELSDYNYVKNNYSLDLSYKNYIPFGRSKVFSMIFDVRFGGAFSQQKSYNLEYDSTLGEYYKDGIYTEGRGCGLNLVPGVMAFVSDELALEVSVATLGVNYTRTTQITNQLERSVMESWDTSFKINLLTINFGLTLYIMTGKHRRGEL